jgi:hypothetical protein
MACQLKFPSTMSAASHLAVIVLEYKVPGRLKKYKRMKFCFRMKQMIWSLAPFDDVA